eukprot:CAMPEP_0194177842 /NCGR_PEP_ID=MMETSP0154-20130528/11547_1 /TAXON_ID=1049557 /ORGANISM="Thalassiothrix antarctica, Strain L6-D1" /LENGTH=67 /DNA_ID=CAMNT_0038892565 /DNA_START=153 /DNA_END=353 /DNA_ORIENTATION=+
MTTIIPMPSLAEKEVTNNNFYEVPEDFSEYKNNNGSNKHTKTNKWKAIIGTESWKTFRRSRRQTIRN